MSYDYRSKQRGRFAIEATLGTDLTSDVATNFFDLRHMPFVINREPMMAKDTTVVQTFYKARPDVKGPERGSATVEAFLLSSDQALIAAASPTKTAQSKIWEAILGGYGADEGDAVAASPSPTTTGFTVADGTSFVEGQLIGVTISSVVYPCLITAIATNALTVWPALPSAPSTAAVVVNSQYNYFNETTEKYLQVLWETAVDRGNIWLLRAAQGDLQLKLDRGGLVTWTTAIKGAVYDHDDEITTPQGGSAIARATYGGSEPSWGAIGGLHFGPTGSTVRTLVRAQSLSINFGIAWEEMGDHNGTEGVGDWIRKRGDRTVELVVEKNAGDGTYEAYHDAFNAGTPYGMLWWLGATGGSIPAICAPTMYINKAPEAVEVNDLEHVKLSLLMDENSLCSDQTTAIRRSPAVTGQL